MALKNRIDNIDSNNVGKRAKIEDFGEHIGGARKDLYMSRGGLLLSDLDDMDEREYEKHLKKDNVWPKLDYVAMSKEGYEPVAMYYIKMLRDALPSKPLGKDRRFAEMYITLVNIYREVAKGIKTSSDLPTVWTKVQEEANRVCFEYIRARNFKKVIDVASLRGINLRELELEVEFQDFPNHFKGALKGLTVRHCSGIYSSRKGYLIIQNSKYIPDYKDIYSTEEEAIKVVKEEVIPKLLGKASEKKKSSSTNKFVRPQLKDINRTGEDYRLGVNISGEDMLRTFGFRGGEFGNWNTQGDRQACLNYSYDAFCDLASVLRVPFDFISLGGYKDKKLAIAFGARGKGGALAHYEPANVVINLTKMKGAGSLAHEWGHALDDYIGIKCGYNGVFTRHSRMYGGTKEYPEVQKAFSDLIQTLKFKDCTDEEIIAMKERSLKLYKSNMTRWLSSFENKKIRERGGTYIDISAEGKAKLLEAKERFLSEVSKDALDNLIKVHKEVVGVLPSKELRDNLGSCVHLYNHYLTTLEDIKNGVVTDKRPTKPTDYFDGAKNLDKLSGGDYFQSNVELFARAFESYVEDTIKSRGNVSDYLVHSTQCSYYPGMSPYPDGEERKLFNAKFKEFLEIVATTFSELQEYNNDGVEKMALLNTIDYPELAESNKEDKVTEIKEEVKKPKKEDVRKSVEKTPSSIESIIGGAFEEFDASKELALTIEDTEPLKVLDDSKVGHFTAEDLLNSCKELGFTANIRRSPKDSKIYKLIFKGNDIIDYVTVGLSEVGTSYNYLVKIVYTNGMFTYEWGNKLGCNGIANLINSKSNKILK